jgi:hypothetical protein
MDKNDALLFRTINIDEVRSKCSYSFWFSYFRKMDAKNFIVPKQKIISQGFATPLPTVRTNRVSPCVQAAIHLFIFILVFTFQENGR